MTPKEVPLPEPLFDEATERFQAMSRIAQKLEPGAEFYDARGELLASIFKMAARIRELEAERDEAKARAERNLQAEHDLSDSYLTVREIIGAMDSPFGGIDPKPLWRYVEDCAIKLIAERDSLRADAERYRWLRRYGGSHRDGLEEPAAQHAPHETLDAAIDQARKEQP
jgi:hypothetical protein